MLTASIASGPVNSRSSKPSKRPQISVDARPGGERADPRLGQRRPARGQGENRRAGRRPPRPPPPRGEHVDAQHHPRPATRRRVVDRAVPVGGEVPDIARRERPDSVSQRAAGEAVPERPGKHLGVEGEDGGGQGHGSNHSPRSMTAAM